jgi:hypothetical protein
MSQNVRNYHPSVFQGRGYFQTSEKVVSTFEMATGDWTHFDPPRDRAEFEPTV